MDDVTKMTVLCGEKEVKAIIFDFDGVILESCDIKTRAFRELFKSYPYHVNEIVSYHREHGGVSRYKKFAYFYEEILKQPLEEGELEELGDRFSNLVLDEIRKCDFVPGAHEFLKKYSKKLRLFVASGTPEQELRAIVKERGLEAYFTGVYGTPATKSEIIKKILNEECLKKDEVIFVGDSETDYKEALKAGVPFVARINDSNYFPMDKQCVAVVSDVDEFDRLLKKNS